MDAILQEAEHFITFLWKENKTNLRKFVIKEMNKKEISVRLKISKDLSLIKFRYQSKWRNDL